ncbi:MAG: elongation factor G, partial [Gemmataceae bacterium]
MENLQLLRNIGISAHIDSGKTTLTERILFYAGKTHKIEEVRGGGDGAVMDHMEQEKERGITFTSAATTVAWEGHPINIIDTPGHVDFTVEVERSLRVLDGAVLVVTAVEGVQSQTLTVDRQMKRYKIPRVVFVNKMDRTGANPPKVIDSLEEKLGLAIVPLQIPIGLEMDHIGAVDLIKMEAVYFDGENGENVRREAIPDDLVDEAKDARAEMLDKLSAFSDEMTELLLEDQEPDQEMIEDVIRKETIALQIVPLFFGSAYKNKGVQLLLDGVTKYLPSPLDVTMTATDNRKDVPEDESEIKLVPDDEKPLVAMAFKLVEEPFGQVTYMRVYQGTLRKGETYVNSRMRKKARISRILRVHAADREDIDAAGAGDIIAVMGIDCATGDTFCGDGLNYSLESIYAPEPVISLSIVPNKRADSDKLSKALNRFMREDPTFRVHQDPETKETIISGMGELHLEIYTDRIQREYGAEVTVGQPKVSYRETCTREVAYDHTRKKQTGGSGQYGKIVGKMIPLPEDTEDNFVFEDNIVQGRIPTEYIPSVEKGFKRAMENGPV